MQQIEKNMHLFSVMITGANRGIGLEFVRQLIQLPTPPKHIFATYRDRKSVQELKNIRDAVKEKINVYLIKMDVTIISEIINASKIVHDIVKEDGLTLLINNAGISQFGVFPEITKDQLDAHFSINAAGPVLLMQAMYPLLKQSVVKQNTLGMSYSKAGVLNISAALGSITNTFGDLGMDLNFTAYKMSKAALNMGMRSCAAESKKDNVLVIMMCPGWVKTDMGTEAASVDLKDSIAAMLETISKLNENHHGTFMDRYGNPYAF